MMMMLSKLILWYVLLDIANTSSYYINPIRIKSLSSIPLPPFVSSSPFTSSSSSSSSSRSISLYESNHDISLKDEGLLHLQHEYSVLDKSGKGISYSAFLQWEEISALLQDGICDEKEILEIWIKSVGSRDGLCSFQQFLSINNDLDDKFEYDDDDDDANDYNIELDDITEGSIDSIEAFDINNINVWDTSIDLSKEVFDDEFLTYLQTFFNSNANEKRLLGYKTFCNWIDIKEMMKQGQVDITCLEDLWKEAIIETKKTSSYEDSDALLKENINFDTFIRLNIRLDMILNEIDDALNKLSDKDVEDFYRSEFQVLTSKKDLLSYTEMLEWEEMKIIIESGQLDIDTIDTLWDALPKQIIPKSLQNTSGRGFSSDNDNRIKEGISVESFLVFNTAIEDAIAEREEIQDQE